MSDDLPIQMFNRTKRGRPSRSCGTNNDATFMFRLPSELKDKLMRAAAANYRGSNAELLYRLEASFANESIDEHGVIVARVRSLDK